MVRLILAAVLIAGLFQGSCFAQDIPATTADGRKVTLKKDGTYSFVEPARASSSKDGSSYQKPEKSTVVFKPKGDRFLIWYDPSLWHQRKSSNSDKPEFEHKDGDIRAVVLAERLDMSMETLKQFALKNAQNQAPNARIVYEENRVVNGKNVLCMKIEAAIQDVRFVFYGYYYAGKAGIIQHLTFAPPNLFSEYERDMTDFLNGLVIND